MKHFFALPALLRASLLLAAASPHTFSVHEDLLAFPQYEARFVDDYLTEVQAESRLQSKRVPTGQVDHDGSAQVEQYRAYGDGDGSDQKEKQKVEHEFMMLDHQRYLCSIPQVKKPVDEPGNNDTLSKAEEEKELARATARGWELLSGMSGNCVYFISGWWSYRFCYGQGVKQFHQLPPSRGVPAYPPVEDPSVHGFELGIYQSEQEKKGRLSDDEPTLHPTIDASDAAATGESEVESALDLSEGDKAKHRRNGSSELVQRGESRYLVQRLGGGTTCDLTGKERRIEVQFHCNPQASDRISLIKETSTCAYLMVIQTPRLCADVAFQPPQKDQPNAITCAHILADDEIEDYERDVQALQEAEQEASQLFGDAGTAAMPYEPLLQIAGDILIGGHAIVPEEVKLEKGAIVGGGKETYIDTVASSDGLMSEAEIKRLGLGDPRAVEKLRKELEKIAQGQQWKLDVIDTPRGREYRGIIGDEEEEEEEEAAEAEGVKEAKKKKGRETPSRDGDGGKREDGTADEREAGRQETGSEEEYYKEEL